MTLPACAQVLCEEMAGAFEGRAMTCPPWRQARAMLSKWLPAKVRAPHTLSLHSPAVSQNLLDKPSMRRMQATCMHCVGVTAVCSGSTCEAWLQVDAC